MKGTQEWTIEGNVLVIKDFAPGEYEIPSITRRIDLTDELAVSVLRKSFEIGETLQD